MNMNIHNVKFILSAVNKSQYPKANIPEVCFAGRSNVGKSTLINSLFNRKQLAKVSGTPGKTRHINFFEVDEKCHIVDLPGYGYARVSESEKQRWGKMIDEYLTARKQLKAVIIIVDSRHKPTADDAMMCDWVKQSGFEPIVIASKADKLKASERVPNVERIKEVLEIDDCILYSGETHEGRDEVWRVIKEALSIEDK